MEDERASCSDESDEDEHGLNNAYSVGDLLGELSSDGDDEGRKDPDCAVPYDSACPDLTVPMNDQCNVASQKSGVELNPNSTLEEVPECHTVPENDISDPIAGTYSRVYDEVLTENIYQDPVEKDDGIMAST